MVTYYSKFHSTNPSYGVEEDLLWEDPAAPSGTERIICCNWDVDMCKIFLEDKSSNLMALVWSFCSSNNEIDLREKEIVKILFQNIDTKINY